MKLLEKRARRLPLPNQQLSVRGEYVLQSTMEFEAAMAMLGLSHEPAIATRQVSSSRVDGVADIQERSPLCESEQECKYDSE